MTETETETEQLSPEESARIDREMAALDREREQWFADQERQEALITPEQRAESERIADEAIQADHSTMPKHTIVNIICKAVKERKLFPQGEHRDDGTWYPTGAIMLQALDESNSHTPAQQVQRRPFIRRFVQLMPSRNLPTVMTAYSGQSDTYQYSQPARDYKRKRTATRGPGRPPINGNKDRRPLRSIRLSDLEKRAILDQYESMQAFVNQGAQWCVAEFRRKYGDSIADRYNQQQEQQHEET